MTEADVLVIVPIELRRVQSLPFDGFQDLVAFQLT